MSTADALDEIGARALAALRQCRRQLATGPRPGRETPGDPVPQSIREAAERDPGGEPLPPLMVPVPLRRPPKT